jgi:hypothetical protein
MCEDLNDTTFEFRLGKEAPKTIEPLCDKCGGKIAIDAPESYHKVYWRCYGRDLYTHNDCF